MAISLIPDSTKPGATTAITGVPKAPTPAASPVQTAIPSGPPALSAMPMTPPDAMSPAPRFNAGQVAEMEDRIGKAGSRRIGGRGAKVGATYRQGEFRGQTQGQAFSQMADEMTSGTTRSANSRGGRAAALSPSNGTMGTGKWALDAMAKKPAGPTTTPAAVMPAAPAADPVADFRRSLGAMAAPQPAAPAVAPAAPAAAPKPRAKSAGAWQGPPAPKSMATAVKPQPKRPQ
jgi:pyruvate dehydrogenase E2 component (dihydrolipoamide acetyltransferase)